VQEIHNILSTFQPITLDEMDAVRLMNRVDTKYLIHIDKLPQILQIAKADYRVVEIADQRVKGYESLYFDTVDHEMYIKHHNRKLNRYKVRIRQYLDSQEFFVEVKFKNNKGRTRKKRIQVDGYDALYQPETSSFVESVCPYKTQALKPNLNTAFERITLVNVNTQERITLDLNLDLHNSSKRAVIPYLVIAEVKREFVSTTDGFGKILRDNRIRSKRISKYCTGTNLLFPELKHNRFKAKMLYLRKLDNTRRYDQLYSAII